jgi:tetratricopeptide (TPR) repeat protein
MGKRSKEARRAPAGRPAVGAAGPRPPSHGWLFAALLLAAAIAYLPALSGPFLFDDRGLERFLSAPAPLSVLLQRLARVVATLSHLAEARLFGPSPAVFHASNILLHLLNGVLVWRILETLLARRGPLRAMDRFAAAAGAGLFLLHPIATEAVAYISSRPELLCVFFSYSAFFVFLRSGEGQAMGPGRAIAVMLLLGLGVLSKEPAVAMVGVFAVFDLLDGERLALKPLLDRWKLYVPLLAGGAAVALRLYRTLSREGSAGVSSKNAPLDYLLTQFEVIWQYFRLILAPAGQNLDHAYPVTKAPGGVWTWLGLAALGALVLAGWRMRRRYPLALFGLLFLLILLAPTSSIVPIDDAMAERRLYLGFAGVSMIAAEFLRRLRPSPAVYGAAGAVLLILATLTWRRAELFTAAIPMWEDSVAANPRNSRAWFHLGFAYYEAGRCGDAVRAYERAAATDSTRDYTLLVDWGLALECAGRLDEAEARLKEAMTLEPDSTGKAVFGRVLAKKGQLDRAIEVLNEAVGMNPADANALVYRGNARLLRGEAAEALADYEAALRIQPQDAAALKGRQSALRALGGKP